MILIVGGAGYIGSHVNKYLNKNGYQTVVFDSLVNGHKKLVKWGEFVLGDLENIDQLEALFKKYPIKVVMHFAAFTAVPESVTDPQKYYLNNVKNTLNLLQVMLKHKVKHFIFSSTGATYGNPIEIPITEKHPQDPINPYGQSKLMIEQILVDYSKAYDFSYAALRYFNAAGADPEGEIGECRDPKAHLIPIVLEVASGKRKEMKIFGTDFDTKDGTCVRDYIHINDLASAHELALEYLLKGKESQVFNLGNGNGFSVKEVIERIEKITGKNIKVVEDGRREGDPPILIASSEKIKKVLGWRPKFADLDVIIETAWKWHKQLTNNK